MAQESNDSLYMVIPAYNERDTIRQVITEWHAAAECALDAMHKTGGGDAHLVVVDDGSTDDTYQIICECAKTKPLLVPLTKPNGGHGAAVLFGYEYALNHGATFVFQTDSDGQTSASEFEGFWNARQDYDMVIGQRTRRQDGASRIFVTKVLKLVLRLCFGVWIADANTPFRLMKAAPLRECMELVPKGFNLSNVALSAVFAKKGLKVKYIPITFKPRQGGKSFINFKNIFKIGLRALKDFRAINKAIDASLASSPKGGTDG